MLHRHRACGGGTGRIRTVGSRRANDERNVAAPFGAAVGKRRRDKARDRELRQYFAAAAGEYQTLRRNEDGSLTLVVGYQAWPFPIPLVQQGAGWRFDADAGRDELINRRVGENEFAAIDVLHDYVEMQRQYAAQARDGEHEVKRTSRKFQPASQTLRQLTQWDSYAKHI